MSRNPAIQTCALPPHALLAAYDGGGAYADCYVVEVQQHIGHAEFVNAFYTTALFKVERALLTWFAARPSSDVQARQLADGQADSFAAWSVEGRAVDQLLLRDFSGRTRSWLMSTPAAGMRGPTRLFFGSAVVPRANAGARRASMGWAFHALLGFHKLYSRALLRAAVRRMASAPRR